LQKAFGTEICLVHVPCQVESKLEERWVDIHHAK